MLRKLLLYLLPFLLPFVVYGVWVLIERRRGKAPGRMPWAPLVFSGVVLMALSFVGVALIAPEDQEGQYVPARVEDGEIIPGRVLPDEGNGG